MIDSIQIPSFESYGNYSSDNYGAHTLVFTDHKHRDFYYSYKTLVAVRVPGKGMAVRENVWGPTTAKHLNWIDYGSRDGRMSKDEFNATIQDWLTD